MPTDDETRTRNPSVINRGLFEISGSCASKLYIICSYVKSLKFFQPKINGQILPISRKWLIKSPRNRHIFSKFAHINIFQISINAHPFLYLQKLHDLAQLLLAQTSMVLILQYPASTACRHVGAL